MKRGFMRCLWGGKDSFNWIDPKIKGSKTNKEILQTLNNKYVEPFITYVWGQENYDFLINLGCDCKLVWDESTQWKNKDHHFRHKLVSFRIAMEDDGYDEIVSLDWDTIPVRPIDHEFWNILNQKESIQVCLYRLNHTQCQWRKNGPAKRVRVNSNFTYFRDKSFPSQIIDVWNNFPDEEAYRWSSEIAMSYFIDELNGGWIGNEEFHNRYEPMVADLKRFSLFNTKREHPLYKRYFLHI